MQQIDFEWDVNLKDEGGLRRFALLLAYLCFAAGSCIWYNSGSLKSFAVAPHSCFFGPVEEGRCREGSVVGVTYEIIQILEGPSSAVLASNFASKHILVSNVCIAPSSNFSERIVQIFEKQ